MLQLPTRQMLAGLALIFFSLTNAATALDDPGPKVGDTLPTALNTVDSKGNPQSFSTVTGEKGAVLVFFRSADWCPYCQRQLINLEKIASDVSATGYSLVGISYDDPEKLAKFAGRKGISFTLLSDKGSVVIDELGIRNPTYPADHYASGVPHPTVLVVSEDGVIEDKFFSDDYKVRPETEVILSAVSD